MKKLIIILFMFCFFSVGVSAENTYKQDIDDLAENYNIQTQDIMQLSMESIVEFIVFSFKEELNQPLNLFYKVLAMVILAGVLRLFETPSMLSINKTIDSVCVIVVFITVMPTLSEIINLVIENLIGTKNFMGAFLPIFASISMASGEIMTASVYTGFFLMSLIFASNIFINYIIPSVNLFLAICVTNSVVEEIKLTTLSEIYLKCIKFLMKIMVSVICFILTLQTTITQSQDNLAVKAGRVVVSGAVPVVGSVLQDAVSSVYASMEVVKGYAGIIGIGGVLSIFLPATILLIIYWFIFNVLIVVSELVNTKSTQLLLTGYKDFIELMLSMVLVFVVLLIFSITIIIKTTQGV